MLAAPFVMIAAAASAAGSQNAAAAPGPSRLEWITLGTKGGPFRTRSGLSLQTRSSSMESRGSSTVEMAPWGDWLPPGFAPLT